MNTISYIYGLLCGGNLKKLGPPSQLTTVLNHQMTARRNFVYDTAVARAVKRELITNLPGRRHDLRQRGARLRISHDRRKAGCTL
jgi:hypothetical protein